MFRFQYPYLLGILSILPLLFLLRQRKKRKKFSFAYPSINIFKTLPKTKKTFFLKALPLLKYLAICFIVLAICRPQSGEKTSEVLSEGIDIVLAIDTSGSMQALDFEKNGQKVDRLTIVKDVVKDFIKRRENDRIGMVVFGQEAFTQCPLTMDYGVLFSFLDKLKIGMAGDSTAIGSAIAISVKRLKDLLAKSKIIVLLTDGRNNAGRISPDIASDIAKSLGIKIYTVGAGTRGKAPFKVETFFGPQYVYKQVDIDEETLKNISQKTQGQYFRATDSESLKKVYEQIDMLEKTKVKVKEYTEYEELFPYFIFPALLLILLYIFLSSTLLRRIP
ncbi:MAG: VWA domain-containing protein [Pseudomonadota bacterium]